MTALSLTPVTPGSLSVTAAGPVAVSGVQFVSGASGSDGADGFSWITAKRSVQAAIDELPARGGTVVVAPGDYQIESSITPVANLRLVGAGYTNIGSGVVPAVRLRSDTIASPTLYAADDLHGVQIEGIAFYGQDDEAGSIGIHAVTASDWTIRDCYFSNYGGQGVYLEAGTGGTYEHLFLDGCVTVTAGLADYRGAFEFGTQDTFLHAITATTAASAVGSGYAAGIVIRGSTANLTNCIGHLSQTGIVMVRGSKLNRLIGCRADQNKGHGFYIDGAESEMIGCLAYRNSRATDNTYDGFYVVNGQNLFDSCRASDLSSDTTNTRYGFNDVAGVGADAALANHYVNSRSRYTESGVFGFSNNTLKGTAGLVGEDFLVTRGKVVAEDGIGVGNSAAATSLGSVTDKIEVFDSAGTSLGFLPVYDAIT